MTVSHHETDPMLRRFERNLAVAGISMAVVPLIFGRWNFALGVACGAALMTFSYRAIRGGAELIMPAGARSEASSPAAAGSHASLGTSSRRRWALAIRFVGRYALLALAAYVMLAYLHAHPVGLLLGAASPVVAVAVEAVRFIRTSSRPGHSR